MLILCYDTETSGLPLFSEPSGDPRQPHIVQLAAALVDTETRRQVSTINLISQPDGWEIPDDVAAIHGITTHHALQAGIPESVLLATFMHLWDPGIGTDGAGTAILRVGHNENFDARIVRIALKRFVGDAAADAWKEGRSECTARLASPIMKMAPTAKMVAAGRKHPKTPKLEEAYFHFTGQELQNAHSAAADMEATLAVWFAIKDQQGIPAGGPDEQPVKSNDLSFLD